MVSYLWNYPILKSVLQHENKVYWRMLAVSGITAVLYVLLVIGGAFSSWGITVSAIIVSLLLLFCVLVSLYNLRVNQWAYTHASDKRSMVEILENHMRLNGKTIPIDDVVNIVEGEFKNSTELNSSEMVDNGKFIYVFVENAVYKRFFGALKSWRGNYVEIVRIPLQYFLTTDDADDFVKTMKEFSSTHNIEYNKVITNAELNREYAKWNGSNSPLNVDEEDYANNCSSLELARIE